MQKKNVLKNSNLRTTNTIEKILENSQEYIMLLNIFYVLVCAFDKPHFKLLLMYYNPIM